MAGVADSATANAIRIGPGNDPLAGLACVMADDTDLYVAFRCRVDPGRGVQVGRNWGPHDGVEIALATVRDKALSPVIVLRGFSDGHVLSSTEAGAPSKVAAKAAGNAAYAVRILEGGAWTAEWRVPLADIGLQPLAAKAAILLNLSIRRTNPDAWLMWQKTGSSTWQLQAAGSLVLPPGLHDGNP